MMKAYLGSEGSHSHCVCELEGKLAADVQRNGGSDGAVLLQVVGGLALHGQRTCGDQALSRVLEDSAVA